MRYPLTALAALLLSGGAAQALIIPQAGYVLGAGDAPLDTAAGTVAMTFALFPSSTLGTAAWTGTCNVAVRGGYYAVRLGDGTCGTGLLPAHLPSGATTYLEVTVGTTILGPRVALDPVPNAAIAANALKLEGSGLTDLDARYARLSVGAAPATTNVLAWNGTAWAPTAAPTTLPVGTAGQILQSNGAGAPSWIVPSAAPLPVATKTATDTLTTSDSIVTVSAAAGSFTLTLPTAIGNTNVYRLIRTDQTLANTVTIATTAGQTINGATTKHLSTQYEARTLVAAGGQWIVLDHRIPTTDNSYTPTGAWTSNATYTGRWQRVGRFLKVMAQVVVSAAPNAASFTITLPAGVSVDPAGGTSLLGNSYSAIGVASAQAAGTSYGAMFTAWNGAALDVWAMPGAGGTAHAYTPLTNAIPAAFGFGGDWVLVNAMLPITNWDD